MARGLRNSGGLRGRHLRSNDADPMASVANIADIMLVFACGLMMALVTVWNIDFTPLSELQDKQLEAIDTTEDMPKDMTDAGNAYVEKGMVYRTRRPAQSTHGHRGQGRDGQRRAGQEHLVGRLDEARFQLIEFSSSSGSKSRAAAPPGSPARAAHSSSAAAPIEAPGQTGELSLPSFISIGDTSLYYPQTCLFGFWNIGSRK